MKLKNDTEYYTQDQSIKAGSNAIVWRDVFVPEQFFVADYQRYQGGGHWAGGVFWKHAAPIQDIVELGTDGNPAPTPVGEVVERYGDVWAKAYIASGVEKTADDTLAVYRVKEASGDFDAKASDVSVDPIP